MPQSGAIPHKAPAVLCNREYWILRQAIFWIQMLKHHFLAQTKRMKTHRQDNYDAFIDKPKSTR